MSQILIPPSFLLAALLATAMAAGFHLVFGGSARRLGLYILVAWTSFLVGQWVGNSLSLALFDIGSVHVAVAALICGPALFLVRWLAQLPPLETVEEGS